MIITLQPNDILTVQFKNTDGEFKIHFDSDERPMSISVEETAGLPGNITGLGSSVLYQEVFSIENKDIVEESVDQDQKIDSCFYKHFFGKEWQDYTECDACQVHFNKAYEKCHTTWKELQKKEREDEWPEEDDDEEES